MHTTKFYMRINTCAQIVKHISENILQILKSKLAF